MGVMIPNKVARFFMAHGVYKAVKNVFKMVECLPVTTYSI